MDLNLNKKKIKNWGIDQLSRVQYKILKLRNWGIDQLSRVQYKILKLRNWPIFKCCEEKIFQKIDSNFNQKN